MRLALVLSLLVSLAGCSKQKSEPSQPADNKAPATENAPAERASAAPPAPEPAPPELPTEGDFEAEAEKITGANLERELDQLERELIGR